MTELDVDVVNGYGGSKVFSLPNDYIAYICGCELIFLNTATGQRSIIWSEKKRPLGALGFNSKNSLFAFSDKGRDPLVYIYSYPEKKVVQTIPRCSKLDIADVAFDRNGNFFATLGGFPGFELQVFNWSGNSFTLVCQEASVNTQPRFVTFNPLNSNDLCTSGGGHVTFWKLQKQQTTLVLNSTEGKVATGHPARLHSHAWSPKGDVLVGSSDGLVFQFDITSGAGDRLIDAEGAGGVSVILVSRHHYIFAKEDGHLRFYNPVLRIVERTFQVPSSAITTMRLTSTWDTIVAGGSEGIIFSVHLPGYENPVLPEDRPFQSIEPNINLIVDFHGGPVTACVPLANTRILATVGADCTFRLWDYQDNCLKFKQSIGQGPTCIHCACDSTDSNIIAIGFSTGTVRMLNCGDYHSPRMMLREKLDASEIIALKFDKEGTQLAVVTGSNKLFFINVTEHFVMGFIQMEEKPEIKPKDLCWANGDLRTVFIPMSNGDVWAFKAPELMAYAHKADHYQYKREQYIENYWKLEYAAVRLCYGACMDLTHRMFAIAEDKCVKVLNLSKERQPEVKDEPPMLSTAHCSFPDFGKQGSSINLSNDLGALLCSGRDGRVTVRNAGELLSEHCPKQPQIAVRSSQRHASYGQGINCACFTHDGKAICTVGADGCVFVLKTKATRKEVPLFSIEVRPDIPAEQEEQDLFEVKRQKEEEYLAFLQNEAHRNSVKQKVEQMAERMTALKKMNADAEENERLEPNEFMVESEKQEMKVLGDKMVEDVKEELKWKNITREYLADKMKKECYDVMQTKIVVQHGLMSDLEVPNYNIRQKDKQDVKLLKKMKFLRKVELAEWKKRKTPSFLEDLFDHTTEVAEETAEGEKPAAAEGAAPGAAATTTPAAPAAAGAGGAASPPGSPTSPTEASPAKGDEKEKRAAAPPPKEGEEGAKPPPPPTDEQLADDSTESLLYSPYEEYTRQRAVTQMMLVNGQVNFLKKKFNVDHVAMLARKKQDISKISERNLRIAQILTELESNEEIFKPSLVPSEMPEKILEVKDDEITVEKYVSPEEQARLEEQRLEQERRRKEQEDDAVERGLKIMMDGRLERDDAVVVKIQAPEFVGTKPQDEWSDEEMKAFKEYEAKLKKKQEEDEKKRKQLEAELKGIKKENTETANQYNGALQELLNTKLDTDQTIYEFELRTIKLAQAILQREEMEIKAVKLAAMLEEIKAKAVRSGHYVEDYKSDLDAMAERYQQYVQEDKNADKKFRLAFDEAGEFLDVLVKLLRKRAKGKGKGKHQDASFSDKDKEEGPVSIDPFAVQEGKAKSQPIEDIVLEKPEGLADDIWQDFLRHRQDRLEMEREMKDCAAELADMQKHYQKIKQEDDELRSKIDLTLKKLAEFHEQSIRESYNMDMLFRFKQGQIEVEQAAVVTDYADAILIHVNRIRELNSDIKASGGEKVKILREIKDFKKEIRAVEWENEMLDYTAGTLEVEYRHLHTLRVTKAMQEFIKGGGEEHNEVERAKLYQKIDHVKKTFESKLEEKRQAILRTKRLIKEKELENIVLDEQTADAAVLVKERDDIVSLQSTGLDQQRAQKMMKDLRVTRKLEDVAKAQQSEIMELKTQIDKLRERTFPSFAVVSKRVVGNPDEKASMSKTS